MDQAQALARFDIGFVLLRAPVDPTLARTLDAVTGLRPVSMTASFDLWRLATVPSRVSVLEPQRRRRAGAVRAGERVRRRRPGRGRDADCWPSPPAAGRPRSTGTPLTAVPSPAGSWAQAFRLPSGGGTLDISRSELRS